MNANISHNTTFSKGYIHIYHGDGKGKTTAAFGLALRCAGGGGKVFVAQFLKDGRSRELDGMRFLPNVSIYAGYQCEKFTFCMNEEERKLARASYQEDLRAIFARVSHGDYQLLILDEVIDAMNTGFVSGQELMEFLLGRPKNLEVVLTGRNPHEKLVELADYVTEMVKQKHPFDKGIGARELIEF